MSDELLSDPSVTLRPWTPDDSEAMVACLNGDPEISRWLDQIPQPYSIEDAQAYIAGEITPGEMRFAITDTASGSVLGSIGLGPITNQTGEIGYWLHADAREGGLATRALVLLSRWALARDDVERVQLRADIENVASRRVADKAGFRLEGVLRSAYFNPRLGRRQDWAMYSLLPSDLA
ncbi:MAG TPA: GNAT family N-acetyltransferase [Gaiellaceae bacterium]|nr:GNAT family N-acetyltransferase [Gaiellaceae bacterium]